MWEVIHLLTEAELLNDIYRTTEMGRDGIETVLPNSGEGPFRAALEQQLAEYRAIHGTAAEMLRARWQEPKGLSPVVRFSAGMAGAFRSMAGQSTSKIAEMMIQGNTMGLTKGLRNLHSYHGKDVRVRELAHKLLATEEANIVQMKPYL